MRDRTLHEWFQWGVWGGRMLRILLNPATFFVIAGQKYGTDDTFVTLRFHSGRADKRLNELDCLQRAVNGQIEEERRKLENLDATRPATPH